MTDSRRARGSARLAELDPGLEAAIEKGLAPVAPDFARFMVEFGFGDVYARPGLALKQRQLVTMASLATLGTAPKQLRGHIKGALNVGLTPTEITEALMQVALYAGFPNALNALMIAKEVFAEAGVAPSAAPHPDQEA
ncbi:MAG: carboxymuconolactone decarboxylase family protein [Brevundimonas sp.]